MTPVTPPTLFRLNGIGTSVCGKRDVDARTGAYVKTLVFTVAFIPIFCLAAYRVLDAPGSAGWLSWRDGWYFLERVPLSSFARFWNWIAPTLLALLIIGNLL
jgi:hypothetical protein